jgi:S-adenosylmethionine synthetase
MKYKTTECVSAGHPDKVADVIADSVLDAHLRVDPHSKVACEVMVKDDIVVLGGEITTNATQKPDLVHVVNNAARILGYTRPELKFAAGQIKVINLISQQSPEINAAVVGDGRMANLGAGDQGIMWGYATDATPNLMPLGMFLARWVMNAVNPMAWDSIFGDCKTQVTIAYDAYTNKPVRVSHVVVSALHDVKLSLAEVRKLINSRIEENLALLPENLQNLFDRSNPPEMIFNYAGAWTFGGPAADTGMTGRKIVVDAYGADCEVGGGAFSGKDGTKVDRSGAYAARYIAKNVVAAGLAKECKVQLGYVIGKSEPVSFNVDFMGTGLVSSWNEGSVERRISDLIPLTPGYFIDKFRLREPRFVETATFGHFGPFHYPWEKTSLVPELYAR